MHHHRWGRTARDLDHAWSRVRAVRQSVTKDTIPAMKRSSVLTITIILAIAAFTPAASAATTPLKSLAGKWTGTLNGAKPKITVTIDLTGQWNGSRIAFRGGINCSGRLTFVGKDATSYRFVERITKTTSTGCALARGIDRFTPLADGSLDYTWKLDGGGQSASTTLRRSVT